MWGEHEWRLGCSRASRGRMTHQLGRRTMARVGRHAIGDTVRTTLFSGFFFFSFGSRWSTINIVSPIDIAHRCCYAGREGEGVRREEEKRKKKAGGGKRKIKGREWVI